MYKVVKMFHDLQDQEHKYNIGDVYPREGYEPSPGRIASLSSADNMQRAPLIVVIEDDPVPAQEPEAPKPAKGRRKAKKDTE